LLSARQLRAKVRFIAARGELAASRKEEDMDNTLRDPEEQGKDCVAIDPTGGLYIRHVEDRALSATVVLPELSEDRGAQGPIPIFVP
jgi:hypothetical protein